MLVATFACTLIALGTALHLKSHQGIADLNTLRARELEQLNNYRAKHGCSPLVLDDSLNQAAQTYS